MIKIPPIKDAKVYTKVYGGFRGCDFTTDPMEISDSRSPDCINMVSDDAGLLQKRVGWRILHNFKDRINGLHYVHLTGMLRPVIIVHHGTSLSAFDFSNYTTTLISSNVNDGPSSSIVHGGKLYILDGAHFYQLTYSSGYTLSQVTANAKTPTTGRGGHYEAEDDGNGNMTYTWTPCTLYEEPNILSSHQINLMAGDGVNKNFWLTELNTTIDKVEIYSGSAWTATTAYTKTEDATEGKTKIAFTSAPAAHPDGAGLDNIRVTFTSSAHPADTDLIDRCTIATQYGYFNDNRFFVSGNPAHKNRDWACDVEDPTYWPLNQWTDVGSDHTAIMGYLHYGDVLAIIKQDDNQDAEIYIRQAAVQSDNSVLFPVQQGVKGVGAVSIRGFATLRDDALYYAKEGVFAVSGTDASQQRTVQNRSYFVDNKLRTEPNKESAVAVAWGNLFLISFPGSGHCYVADSRSQVGMNESFVYDWFYWENIFASQFLEFDGNLFFGTQDGDLCRFNSDFTSSKKFYDGLVRANNGDPMLEATSWTGGDGILARWTTKMDNLGVANRYKTLMKRGCAYVFKTVAGGNYRVYATTEKGERVTISDSSKTLRTLFDFSNIDFGNIQFDSMRTPPTYAMNRKIKKFIFLQFIFENDEPGEDFGLSAVQLQYIVNNYIK